jgi:hypothetical protein
LLNDFNDAHWNPDVIEACLAHKTQDRIRAKYNRAEYLAQRRDTMQRWADYLDTLTNEFLSNFGREHRCQNV